MVEACLNIGFRRENILLSTEVRPEDIEEIKKVDYIYVTEGNTFEIAALLKDRGIDEVIREAFKNGATYSGASAGAMLAGESIEEALLFDRNEVGLKDYKGLCLMDGIVIPHYTNEECRRYIKNTGIGEKYKKIRSVANNKILVINVKK